MKAWLWALSQLQRERGRMASKRWIHSRMAENCIWLMREQPGTGMMVASFCMGLQRISNIKGQWELWDVLLQWKQCSRTKHRGMCWRG